MSTPPPGRYLWGRNRCNASSCKLHLTLISTNSEDVLNILAHIYAGKYMSLLFIDKGLS